MTTSNGAPVTPDRRRVVTPEEIRAMLPKTGIGEAEYLSLAVEARQLREERDEARRTLARIVEKIGPDYVSMEGGPPMAVDLDPLEAVSGLIEQATAQADEASRARGEAARLREEVARLRAVVRS
jgi:hypothetical protein